MLIKINKIAFCLYNVHKNTIHDEQIRLPVKKYEYSGCNGEDAHYYSFVRKIKTDQLKKSCQYEPDCQQNHS